MIFILIILSNLDFKVAIYDKLRITLSHNLNKARPFYSYKLSQIEYNKIAKNGLLKTNQNNFFYYTGPFKKKKRFYNKIRNLLKHLRFEV